MKKIIPLIILTILLIPNKALAKDVTFTEIANKFKEKFDFSKIDAESSTLLQPFEDAASITTTLDKIEIKYNLPSSTTTIFKFSNGKITYKIDDAVKNDEQILSTQALADTVAMMKLFYIIGELKGFSTTKITEALANFKESDYTTGKNGLTMTSKTYQGTTENFSITYSDTMTLDLASFNLGGPAPSANDKTPTTTNKDTNIENLKTTADTFPIMIGITLGCCLLIIYQTTTRKKTLSKL